MSCPNNVPKTTRCRSCCEKLGTSHDIKALPLAHFSMVGLKEQIFICIKKKNVESAGSDYRKTDQFLAKFAQKIPTKTAIFYWLFVSEVYPKIPMKSADFSANLSLNILRNLTFFPRPIRSPGILTKQHGIHGHFRDSNFENVPRCLSPQELVPLVQVPKLATFHCQPACT